MCCVAVNLYHTMGTWSYLTQRCNKNNRQIQGKCMTKPLENNARVYRCQEPAHASWRRHVSYQAPARNLTPCSPEVFLKSLRYICFVRKRTSSLPTGRRSFGHAIRTWPSHADAGA